MQNPHFSPGDCLFYFPAIHGNKMPADARPISSECYEAMLSARSIGQHIQADAEGRPYAVTPQVNPEVRREALRKRLSREREQRELAGFPYQGKTLQADAGSRERITTAVLAALAAQAQGQAYTLAWRCADNSTLQLDVAGVLGLPVAMAQHSEALHQHCQARKAELEALDLAGLLAFDVAEGWPA